MIASSGSGSRRADRSRPTALPWWHVAGAVLSGVGCAASMRPVVPSSLEAKEPTTVAVDQELVKSFAVSGGCYTYIALIDYTTPTAGAKESISIPRGRRYKACYEANDIGDYVYLTDVHWRSNIWLGIQRDGFVGTKGGWWSYLATEGPADYRATHLFQGKWGRSKWITERLFAPEEAQIVYEGQDGGEIHLSYRTGAPAAGVPFQDRGSCNQHLGGTEVGTCGEFSIRILAADDRSVTFILTRKPGASVPEARP